MSSVDGKIEFEITVAAIAFRFFVNCCMFYYNNKNLISATGRIPENSNLMNYWTKAIIL